MNVKLIETTTAELLSKFGSGKHKPGSGSASAFQGLLSVQMLRTVVELTMAPKRRIIYSKFINEFERIKQQIEQRIQNELESLFQLDSEEFDKVISLRNLRDQEQDRERKKKLADQVADALLTSTETPLKIAELCLELGNFAIYVFENGFRAARGDSGVALNCAVSGVASCLSIIELNLISLPFDERTEEILKKKRVIKERYDKLSPNVEHSLSILENEVNEKRGFYQSILGFKNGKFLNPTTSNHDIEIVARSLQNTIWKYKDYLWKKGEIKSRADILQPSVVLEKIMDYTFAKVESLETYEYNGEIFEIAGLIDKNIKAVKISKSFPIEVQSFTSAHELGHAILHKQVLLHRDRPIDGSVSIKRSREEMQADKFATYFLMPTKLVKEVFFEIFGTSNFIINEGTLLGLSIKGVSVIRLKNECQNRRGLSRLLSATEFYNGRKFNSIAKVFKVSVETMAIRLEELELLEF